MTFTFTLLRDGVDYVFIWSSHPPESHSLQPITPNLCWAKIELQPVQQAELQAAIDSAAQVPVQLRAPAPTPDASAAPAAHNAPVAHSAPLRRLGRVLFSQILPPPLQALLRELPPATPLRILTNETELPWELLHDGEEFLALRHALARQMLLRDPGPTPAAAPLHAERCLLIGNPNGNLPAADSEIEKLVDLLDTSPIPLRVEFLCREQATKLRVLSALASGDYQIIHFACHARPDALRLADGWLQAAEIRAILRGNPLVFLNGCNSAREQSTSADAAMTDATTTAWAGAPMHSLAQAFLAGGSAAFIGTLWPVEDDATRGLALEFYRTLCYGASLGTALQEARRFALQQAAHTLAWAAPVLYGAPDYRLPSPVLRTQPGTVLTAHWSDAPSADVSPRPAALRALQQFLTEAGHTITAHSGTVIALHPHQICAIFGVPGALEDDATRATQAALELARLATTHQRPLAAGVASGEISIGSAVATPHAPGIPLYLGPVFAEADQLAAQAHPGQVLVNARTRRLGAGHFAFASVSSTQPDTDNDDTGDKAAENDTAENNATQNDIDASAHLPEHAPDAIFEVAPLAITAPAPLEAQPWVMPAPDQILGRTRELAQLHAYWQESRGGRGSVVGITGQAGVGKTRLLRELRRSLSDPSDPDISPHTWVSLSCSSTSQDRPYMLVGQLLRQIFAIDPDAQDDAVDAEIARRLSELSGVQAAADPQLRQVLRETLGFAVSELPVEERKARRGRLVHLLRTLMAHAARTRPLLIAIDDVHWIDEASMEILGQVTDGIGRLPVQFVLLYRPDWQHPWFDKPYYRHLPLDELDEVACIELICMLLQTDRLPKGLSSLLQKTGGNPFFIAEMVKSLQERDVLVRRATQSGPRATSGEWALQRSLTEHQLPGTVERVLRVRLDRLRDATRRVLEVAAVIGPTFSLTLLKSLISTPPETLESHLAELEERGFIEARWQAQDYRFCHALILDTIYQDMPSAQRQAWHRRIGETLEAAHSAQGATRLQAEIETLAHHAFQSLLLSRPTEPVRLDTNAPHQQITKALDYLQQCGARALGRYAAREAINYYQRALLLLPLLPDRWAKEVALHEGIGDAQNILGYFEQAYQALRQAYAALHTMPLRHADCRHAADLARRLGRLCAWLGEHEAGLRWMQQGQRELGDYQDDADRATAALLEIHMGAVYYNKGEQEDALAHCQAGLELVDASQADVCAEGHNLLGVIFSSARQNRLALDHYQQSLALWQAQDNHYQAIRVAGNIGIVHYDEGNLAEAQRFYAQGLDYLEEIEDLDRLAYRHLNLGNVYLCRGEWDAARQAFATALALWEPTNNQRWIALCHINLGLLAIEQTHWDQAEQELSTARELLLRLDIRDMQPEAYYSLADVALGRGDPAAALDLARQATTLAEALDMPFETALARRAEGRALLALDQRDAGRTCLLASVRQLRDLNSRYEVGRTLYWLAMVEIAHDSAAAQHALDEAEAIFTPMGAAHELAKIKAIAEQLPAARTQ